MILMLLPVAVIFAAYGLDNTDGRVDKNPVLATICFTIALLLVGFIIVFPFFNI